jgi:oligopeptidase B
MSDAKLSPPVAKVVPVKLQKHGHVRTDNYYWLNERDDPEVVTYLEAENAYTEGVMAHTGGLQQALFEEIRDRIKQTDMSVPYKKDDYFYYTRFEDGKEYPIHCRKKENLSRSDVRGVRHAHVPTGAAPGGAGSSNPDLLRPDAPEEVILDVNVMAEGHEFFSVGLFKVSSGQDTLAYPVDAVGRRIYTIHFKDLSSGKVLPDTIPGATANMAWAEDNKTLFYTKQDPTTLRWHRVYRHDLGTDPAHDQLVYEETDETFSCFVLKTKSKQYIMIGCQQTLATEFRYLEADDPGGAFRLFLPREREHEYWVDHYRDHFYIRSNDQAKNFRLMKTPVGATAKEDWREVIPHRDDVLLEGFELFRDHLAVVERERGLVQIGLHPWSGEGGHYLDFGEPAYLARLGDNHEFDTPILRYTYTSLTTPESVFDYNVDTREKELLKQEEVLGGFDAKNYQTERL